MCDQAENRTLISRVLLSVLVLLLLASLVAACDGSGIPTISPPVTSKPSVPQVTITAKEFSFAIPDGIQTGLVDFTVVNVGVQEHQAQFDRLNDGATLDQLKAAVNQGGDAALSLITFQAEIAPIKPGQSQEIILDLAAGHYVVLDLSSGALACDVHQHRRQMGTLHCLCPGYSRDVLSSERGYPSGIQHCQPEQCAPRSPRE